MTSPMPDCERQGERALADALADIRRDALAPSPRLTLSEWADEHAVLSAEGSAEPGPWRGKAWAWQRGIMDAMTDPAIHTVIVKKSARVGYTQMLAHLIGYHSEHDPAPVLLVQPTDDDARDFAKSTVDPMFRDTPCLRDLARELKRGETQSEWHTRYLNNGAVLRIRGAHSDDTFRRITTRVNVGDEVDAQGWTPNASTQGDKVELLRKRGDTFWNAKTIVGSTPLVEGSSRIDALYGQGDQRVFRVPCPHCGTKQPLEWGGRDQPHGFRWRDGDPDTVIYRGVCGCEISERHKPWMIENGEWVATAEARSGVASFRVWSAYSLFPKASWREIVAGFLAAKNDPSKLQPWVNLVLGETWSSDRAAPAKPGTLQATHTVPYQSEVPAGARFITAGVDVQSGDGGRFEATVVAWGHLETAYVVGHWILDAHPLTDPRAWAALDELLLRQFRRPDGTMLPVSAAAVDSGHLTTEVYDFANARAARRVWAIKGESSRSGSSTGVLWSKAPTPAVGARTRGDVYRIDTILAKDTIAQRFRLEVGDPGAWCWPAVPLAGAVPCDERYFERLLRERPIEKWVNGRLQRSWTSPSDQEPWDCALYAYAAMRGLRLLHPAWNQRIDAPPENHEVETTAPAATAAPTAETADPKPTPTPPKPPARQSPAPVRPRVIRSRWTSG